MKEVIHIDGSQGEGGGQVLRSALALSVITGTPVRIDNIRRRRPQPGLKPQHLKAVEAAATVCGARVEGAALGAYSLSFSPGKLRPGDYRFDVGTAGATSLVLQTIALPLALADAPSRVEITGGTHVPWSPSFDYLASCWVPALRAAGLELRLELLRAGFYPPGGGHIRADIQPWRRREALVCERRGNLQWVHGISAVAGLNLDIAVRQERRATERLANRCEEIDIEVRSVDAPSPGTFLLLVVEFEHARWCCCTLGAHSKPAERVADEAVDALERFLASNAAMDEHLADQLMLPLALVPGRSIINTAAITPHLLTNAAVIRAFLPADITMSGGEGEPGVVTVQGVGKI
jgi:RNA 3'-phosphate cyclase